MKIEWRKQDKKFYLPKNKPELIEIPVFKFITIEGFGNPNNEDFSDRVAALYSISYAIRMSYKWPTPPKKYNEFTVYPLEGVWDIYDKEQYIDNQLDKNNLKYKIMIRQPNFVDTELYQMAYEKVCKKKANKLLCELSFEESTEGKCIQMLHIGSFDTENESFKMMEEFCDTNNFRRLYKTHREIYLTDPRKTTIYNLKTVLRYNVRKN